MLSISRFKIKIDNDALIIELQKAVDTLYKLEQICYVSCVATMLGLKKLELYIIVADLDLKVRPGRKSGKLIFHRDILKIGINYEE